MKPKEAKQQQLELDRRVAHKTHETTREKRSRWRNADKHKKITYQKESRRKG
jgi:hypothetical protein